MEEEKENLEQRRTRLSALLAEEKKLLDEELKVCKGLMVKTSHFQILFKTRIFRKFTNRRKKFVILISQLPKRN